MRPRLGFIAVRQAPCHRADLMHHCREGRRRPEDGAALCSFTAGQIPNVVDAQYAGPPAPARMPPCCRGGHMADFVQELKIAASPDSLRKLIAERGDAWWTTNALIDSQVGGSCEFRFPAAGFHALVHVMKNSEELVEWYCVDSAMPKASGFKNLHDWIGSIIACRLTPAAGGTNLRLQHRGLAESAEFYSPRDNVWAHYL